MDVLENIDMRELGYQLRQARERRGLTQQDAAAVIDVARTTIVAIEKGERHIQASELARLANAYGRDIGDFLRETHPKTASFLPQFEAVSRKNSTITEIDSGTVNELEQFSRYYVELEEITQDRMRYKYPEEYYSGDFDVERVAENIAYEERKRLGLGDSPVHILRNVLEEEVGLRIFYLTIKPEQYGAIYIYDQKLGGCIAVNITHPEERRRWSLAHEYAHFLIHRHHADIYTGEYQRLPERERFAETFASHFLIPASSLMRQVREADGQVSAARLFVWANYYGVSVQALARRLETMKVLSASFEDVAVSVMEPAQYADKLPLRYRYLAVEALEKGLISEGLFTQFLQVSRPEARRIFQSLRTGVVLSNP